MFIVIVEGEKLYEVFSFLLSWNGGNGDRVSIGITSGLMGEKKRRRLKKKKTSSK